MDVPADGDAPVTDRLERISDRLEAYQRNQTRINSHLIAAELQNRRRLESQERDIAKLREDLDRVSQQLNSMLASGSENGARN
jgi:hypothetical protein